MSKLYKSIYTVIPVDSPTRNASISTATAVTLPSDATGVFLQADTDDVRYTIDGTTPTGTLGMILVSGNDMTQLDLYPGAEVNVISASGAINYQFFRREDTRGIF